MKAFFSGLTRLSLRFRAVTLIIAAVISAAGIIAVTQLQQELIPGIEFPQTIILSQATGMTSEQVLTVLTERLENALDENVDDIINIESQTTGAFGAVITAYNDFGLNQARLRREIQTTLDNVWLPVRAITPPQDVNAVDFAHTRMADLTPDVLIYLAERDSNFLFQLSQETWLSLSPETTRGVLAYLAAELEETDTSNVLLQLIEQEISPALLSLPQVASVSISGGQALPGEEGATSETPTVAADARSVLYKLSPEVWSALAGELNLPATLDQSAIDTLAAEAVEIPTTAPELPSSWQIGRFINASDLYEMQTLTRTLAAVFNGYLETGRIVGSLGQTDDLTPEVITQMLEIEPSLVEYFKAEHLAAMSDDVFAALPDDFIAGLDGFTRDELAARALAQAITGEAAEPTPVDLPQAWRISPPQLITFSFDDLPLATFTVSGTGLATSAPVEEAAASPEEVVTAQEEQSIQTETELPEGPALPLIFSLIGGQFGVELNTADDLINLQLPEEAAAQFGDSSLPPAQLFNFLLLLGNPDALPEGIEMPPIPINVGSIISSLSPDVVSYLAEHDPTFLSTLSSDVYNLLSDDVLSLPQVAPPLDGVWSALANQPQFANAQLISAADVVALGDGSAANVLNTINASIPERFTGYDVRLFDSLSPAVVRYFSLQEADFYETLAPEVVAKFSPATLAVLPESVITPELAEIASGNAPSAADQLAELYASDVPAADPNAPALNSEWQFVGDFIGVELNSADDYFRFFPDVTSFLNSLFDSAQGASFTPGLFGGWTPETIAYINERDASVLENLRVEALQLLTPDTVVSLPASVQERLASGAAPFTPTNVVTRTNGSSSMSITVYKTDGANTVEVFHAVESIMHGIDEADDSIIVGIGFEQASFIEESISGVAREGGLGAVFAVIVILVFLSGGAAWGRKPRAIVGAVMVALFLGLLGLIVFSNANATGGDLGLAFDQTDVVLRVLLIGGIITGLLVMLFPGKLPNPAWRSTLVSAVSIPLSVLMALVLMRWLPGAVHSLLEPAAESSSFITFLMRLFPESITLNIMTLSGLTVAIGRVVDDSIVVLENIFRQIQSGGDRKEAIIQGTKDVSVAIFAATIITVVVFLPLGLTGGIIGEFFLPFGLAVTYSLLASFVVAITVVPVLAYLLLDEREISHEHQQSWLERIYIPVLKWALSGNTSRIIVLLIAAGSLVLGGLLFSTRPMTFLPALGEPQISVAVNMPAGTRILETNALVEAFETFLSNDLPHEEIGTIQTIVGGSGASIQSLLLGGGGVSENIASITVAIEASSERLDALTGEIRSGAQRIFGEGNVTVSAASISEQGFGGFALVLSGDQEELITLNDRVIETLNNVEGLANVSSNLSGFGGAGGSDAPTTYIRVNGDSAVSYTGELETENTLGVSAAAKQAILDMPDLPAGIHVGEGFQTELQTQGFSSVIMAMGIAIVIVIIILIITFGSFLHWFDIILSIVVAPVGAAIMLTLTNRVLGISALIGLLMLIGIVVTNAVVLIDRVQANRRERKMNVYDALIEAGDRRLRPILMTAIATICALIPLAVGLSEGAIIASELGTVVIGGLFSSTLLTLIIVPVMYSIIARIGGRADK